MNLIPLLNEDLALEYAAAIQYMQHAARIAGLYTAFAEELATHAEEELGHAKLLNEHIAFLGGVPSVAVGQVLTASDSVVMLKQDLEGEQTAIARYTERTGQARGQGDYGTEAILLEILKQEQQHSNDLRTILDG